MTGTVSRAAIHDVVEQLQALSGHDCAGAWTTLTTWAAAFVLDPLDRRPALAAPSGRGTVTVADGHATVTGSWLGAPADAATEVYVVVAELDGEPVAIALERGDVTTRTYTDAGLDALPLVRIVCTEVVVPTEALRGAPAPVVVAVAGIVAGLAQELTDQVTTLARTKVRSGTADVLLGDPVVLHVLQRAHVELDALVTLLRTETGRAQATGDPSHPRLHVAAHVLIERAEELVARIVAPVGSAALYLTSPLQRLVRELTSVARHAGTVPDPVARAALEPRP